MLVGARDGAVWAFDAETGQIVWQYSTDGYVDASPAVDLGMVFVPSCDGKMYAFLQENGEDPAWTYTTGSMDMSSPVVYNKR
ncbi:MAG: PQQ-binding-like beta-propeller repeat protein, partial [Proteobacteria bacterium]|nr:PQQ-binding-like beta-propeller repeat protein [Pseudomonadota bacterium]